MTNTNEKINDFRPEIRSLIKRLVAAGFLITRGHNGEYGFRCHNSLRPNAKFIADLDATDETHLYAVRADDASARVHLFLVLGNSPGELVCDTNIPKDPVVAALLDKVCADHADEWEGRAQPKTTWAKKYGTNSSNESAHSTRV